MIAPRTVPPVAFPMTAPAAPPAPAPMIAPFSVLFMAQPAPSDTKVANTSSRAGEPLMCAIRIGVECCLELVPAAYRMAEKGRRETAPVGSSGLHDPQTCFAFSHGTASTRRLGGTSFGCRHSTASAFLCHCDISFLSDTVTSKPVSAAWKHGRAPWRPVSFGRMEMEVQLMAYWWAANKTAGRDDAAPGAFLSCTYLLSEATRIKNASRRFCAMALSEFPDAIGCVLPRVSSSIRLEATPCATRESLTASARRVPSARLYAPVPRLSVCPTMRMRIAGLALNTLTLPSSASRASSVRSDWSYAKCTSSCIVASDAADDATVTLVYPATPALLALIVLP